MKFMKLGIRPDTFYTEEATRTVISDAETDLIIQINNICYLLHKLQCQLVPKCGLLQQLFSDSKNASLEFHDIPGGEEAFEVCAKYCYGITINLSAQNIVPSLCAAKYLRMNEAIHKGNLALKLETFFNSCILEGWKDSVISLHTTSKLPEWSESLGIVRRCIDSIVDKILTPLSKVTWSYTYTRPGYTRRNRQYVPKDWWTEDISDLSIDLFQCVISAVESTNTLPPQLIGEALHVYASRWLLESSRNNNEAPETSSQIKNKITEKQIIETIVSMIPADKGSVSIGFLLRLLQISYVLGASQVTKTELVRRISQKLEEATVNDLINLYNIVLVEAVLESYVLHWRRRQQQHSTGVGHVALRSIQKIGKLVDCYLQVVAVDVNTPVGKFVSLAKALPEVARPVHDDLYKAIHVYLKEHPDMGKSEKKQLCSVIESQKLSKQARAHAVRNDLLPLRTVVQLLFFEQEEMKSTKAFTTTQQ